MVQEVGREKASNRIWIPKNPITNVLVKKKMNKPK